MRSAGRPATCRGYRPWRDHAARRRRAEYLGGHAGRAQRRRRADRRGVREPAGPDRRAGRGRPGHGARPRPGTAARPVRAVRDRLRQGGMGGRDRGWQRMSPFTVPMLMPNGSAGWIGIELGARAGVHTTVSACASGAEAIGHAIDMIRMGRADVVLAGGTEAAIIPLNIAAFAAMRALSTRNDEPERASRPFDKGRDGFVLGEGAGMVVLESAEHAQRRGARLHAVAAGSGYSADAHHIAQPEPGGTGIVAAIQAVLADAALDPDQVVHVNAHATSTP